MRKFSLLLTALIITCTAILSPQAYGASAKETTAANNIKKLETAVKSKNWRNAATYSNQLAIYYEEIGQYDNAVRYFDENAEYSTKAGIHPSFAVASTIRADHLRTSTEVYVSMPVKSNRTLEKFEPLSGAYIGMFPGDKLSNADYSKIESLYGKKHAIFLTYAHWRRGYEDTNSVFPVEKAAQAKAAGGALQIGWEPSNGLDDVLDDEYVRQFAREAKESGIPIFLRFAGEMNGPWVPWNDKPEKYIEKFRLIHDIMEEEAPNVAMVWSPNFLPRDNIDPFYPGDKYVDWVGFSLYTIPYSQGREVPGGSAIDYLRPLYEKYSKKPIMVSEGAISFVSYQLGKTYSNWAVGQLDNMYTYLARIFPQVKAITYFNLDKMTTNYDNQNNNYDLSDDPAMLKKYKKVIQSNYFLSNVETGATNNGGEQFVPINKAASSLKGKMDAMVYVKLPLGNHPYYVAIYQGKTKLGEAYAAPWSMEIDFDKVKLKEPITVIAFDKNFKRLSTTNMTIKP